MKKVKSYKSALMGIAAIAVVLGMGSARQLQARLNFTGSYTIDSAKSNFGGLVPALAAPQTIRITQDIDRMTIERKFAPIPLTTETLRFDGTPTEIHSGEGEKAITRTAVLKWSEDGRAFTVAGTYTNATGATTGISRTEAYSLSADGKTLTLDRITKNPDSTEHVKAIYLKN